MDFYSNEILNCFTDIATRLCVFLRQSGLTEKSISIYQALMELTLNPLGKFSQNEDLRSMMAKMQTFWNSCSPRFGEESTVGPDGQPNRIVQGNDCR